MKTDTSKGWFGTPKKRIIQSGKCAVSGAPTTHTDSVGTFVDATCEEKFMKEKKAEATQYEK